MTAPGQLVSLQQWLLATITDPAAIGPQAVCQRISASRQLAAHERLGIYQTAYFARLLEVLRELFPATRFAAGDETFDQLVTGYLLAHPPRSYTLARLADQLPDYLNATRPKDGDWGLFLVELARLEQTIDRIFDGPGPETLPRFVLPCDADERLRLRLVPGCELLSFEYPVSTFYTEWKASREPAWPRPQTQHLALWRRDYIVRRCELSEVQYRLLRAIEQGETLAAALASAAAAEPSLDIVATQVRNSFTAWSATGLFAG